MRLPLCLWKRIHDDPSPEARKRTGAGFSGVAVVAQFLFAFTSGGASPADAEPMGKDRVLMDLLGLGKGADQSTLALLLEEHPGESSLTLRSDCPTANGR